MAPWQRSSPRGRFATFLALRNAGYIAMLEGTFCTPIRLVTYKARYFQKSKWPPDQGLILAESSQVVYLSEFGFRTSTNIRELNTELCNYEKRSNPKSHRRYLRPGLQSRSS